MLRILLPPAVYYLTSYLVYALLRPAAGAWPGYETLSAAVTAALVLLILGPEYRKDLEKRNTCGAEGETRTCLSGARRFLYLLLCFALGILFSLLSSRIMELAGIYARFSNRTQEAFLAAPFWLQIPSLILLVPICEELVWRGLFYSRLKERIPAAAAALIASAFFAAGHGNVIQIIYAFPSALIMICLLEKGGTLAAPVLFHIGANLISVVITMFLS